MGDLTHDNLVAHAAMWLRRKHCLVITEMATGEEADAIGWYGGQATLIECKAYRSDFLSDKKKMFRKFPDKGMAAYRYFMTPMNLIDVHELPDCWGLMEVRKGRIFTLKKAVWQDHNELAEKTLLLSAIRRIGQTAPEGISVRFYTHQTKCKATLSVETEMVNK